MHSLRVVNRPLLPDSVLASEEAPNLACRPRARMRVSQPVPVGIQCTDYERLASLISAA